MRADDAQTQPSPFRDRQHGNTPSVPANGSDDVQATSPESGRWQDRSHNSTSYSSNMPAGLRRSSANELTGMQLHSRDGESLGKIKDFIVDTSSGQVVYAVVGSGGVAGIGESLRAVPVSALKYDSSSGEERLSLNLDSNRWSQAPRFRKNDVASLQADREGRSTYEFYGQSWPQRGPSSSPNGSSQPLVMARDLIGKDVTSSGQTVGEIEDLLVQLQGGGAAAVLDANADFAGKDQKYIVPLSRFSMSSGDSFSTTLTQSDFKSARQLQGDSWASASSNPRAQIYVWPSSAGASASVNSGRSIEQTAQNDTVIPSGRKSDDVRLSQSGSSSSTSNQGQPPLTEVRRAIQSDSSLAQQGSQNVQVVGQGDKIVLLGTVSNKEAKDRIQERVEKAAPGWDVQNQIRVTSADE